MKSQVLKHSTSVASVYKLVRRYAFRLPRGELFTTRDVLIYGSRNSVDQALYRLVKRGIIVRFARGVFAIEDTPPPDPFTLATTKAKAFFKKLTRGCSDLVDQFGLQTEDHKSIKPEKQASKEITFTVAGCTSSFRYGDITIRLRGISGRRIQLGETKVGGILRALWYLGKSNIDPHLQPSRKWDFNRPELAEFDEHRKIMPAWLSNICFKNKPWIWRPTPKFEPLPLDQYDSEWDEEEFNEFLRLQNSEHDSANARDASSANGTNGELGATGTT